MTVAVSQWRNTHKMQRKIVHLYVCVCEIRTFIQSTDTTFSHSTADILWLSMNITLNLISLFIFVHTYIYLFLHSWLRPRIIFTLYTPHPHRSLARSLIVVSFGVRADMSFIIFFLQIPPHTSLLYFYCCCFDDDGLLLMIVCIYIYLCITHNLLYVSLFFFE